MYWYCCLVQGHSRYKQREVGQTVRGQFTGTTLVTYNEEQVRKQTAHCHFVPKWIYYTHPRTHTKLLNNFLIELRRRALSIFFKRNRHITCLPSHILLLKRLLCWSHHDGQPNSLSWDHPNSSKNDNNTPLDQPKPVCKTLSMISS
jgi:hypothetical protein